MLLKQHSKNAVLVKAQSQVKCLSHCAVWWRGQGKVGRDETFSWADNDWVCFNRVVDIGLRSQLCVIYELAEPITEGLLLTGRARISLVIVCVKELLCYGFQAGRCKQGQKLGKHHYCFALVWVDKYYYRSILYVSTLFLLDIGFANLMQSARLI